MARSVKMLSDMDTTMMEVERVDRVGDRLMITGTMMGSFPAEVYVAPSDLLGLIVMHLRPSPLSFVFGFPFFWLRCHWRRPENGGVAARAGGALLAAALALGGLGLIAVFALGVVELVRLACTL